MIHKIDSPGNCAADFPARRQWSKLITVHTVKVSTRKEDREQVSI